MKTTVHNMQSLFTPAAVRINTTSAGLKFCHLKSPEGPSASLPVAFVISDERNLVEQFIVHHTLKELAQLLGYMPEVQILCGHSQSAAQARCYDHIVQSAKKLSAVVALSPWNVARGYERLPMNAVDVPFLFANVTAPVAEQMSRYSSANGVGTTVQDYHQQLTTIRDLMPHIRRLLLPHDNVLLHGVQNRFRSNVEEGNIAALATQCQEHGLEPVFMGVPPESRLAHDIKFHYRDDAMFVLTREGTALNQMDTAIKACNQLRLPMFSDLPLATLHGSAFGSGDSGVQIASPLAQMLYQVLTGGNSAAKLQTVNLTESNQLLYNDRNFARQGVTPSEEQMRLLKAQHILLYAKDQQLI